MAIHGDLLLEAWMDHGNPGSPGLLWTGHFTNLVSSIFVKPFPVICSIKDID